MSIFLDPGSMPVWSYYIWGIIGLVLFVRGCQELTIVDQSGKRHFYIEELFIIILGIFLIYYWVNKIGIVPWPPWAFDSYFYKF